MLVYFMRREDNIKAFIDVRSRKGNSTVRWTRKVMDLCAMQTARLPKDNSPSAVFFVLGWR